MNPYSLSGRIRAQAEREKRRYFEGLRTYMSQTNGNTWKAGVS